MVETKVPTDDISNKHHGRISRANYNDRNAADGRLSSCQLFRIEGCLVFSQWFPSAVGYLLNEPVAATYLFMKLLNWPPETHEYEWTPFPKHYYSEKYVVPGMEPSTILSVARDSND
jgi:hypothetical protein